MSLGFILSVWLWFRIEGKLEFKWIELYYSFFYFWWFFLLGFFYLYCVICILKRIFINCSVDERGWWCILYDIDFFLIEDLFNFGFKIFICIVWNNVLLVVFIVFVNFVFNVGYFVFNLVIDKLSIWLFFLFVGSRVLFYFFFWM